MPFIPPAPKFRAVGSDGLALVGGKLYTYSAGTSTLKESFTDYGLGTANANPIILDARGECDLWGDGNYKLTLTDADDVQIWSVDNIRDLTNGATLQNTTLTGTLTVTGSQVAWPGDPIHTGNHRFANNVTINGNTVLGDSAADTLTIGPNAVAWGGTPVTHTGTHKFSGQPGFSAYTTSAFNVGQSSTPADVIYTLEDYDNGACYASGTGIFTAPVAGRYMVSFGLTPNFAASSAAGTVFTAVMLKNGASLSGRATLYSVKTLAGAATQIGPTLAHADIYTLAANDTLKWVASYSDATSIQCTAGSCVFSVELLG